MAQPGPLLAQQSRGVPTMQSSSSTQAIASPSVDVTPPAPSVFSPPFPAATPSSRPASAAPPQADRASTRSTRCMRMTRF